MSPAHQNRLLLALLLVGLAGCPRPEPTPSRPVSISTLFKPSCDSICGATCLACVDALQVFATDPEGRALVSSQCLELDGRWETLCDLSTGAALLLLEDIPVGQPVIIEVRAYRNRDAIPVDAGVDAGPVCAPPLRPGPWHCDGTSGDLMLWGRSRPTNLSTDAGLSRIEVEFECRAGCDCLDIAVGKPGCPELMPESACLASRSCTRSCSSDQDCFEGALRCDIDAGECDPNSAASGASRPFCASCQNANDCADRLCVGRVGADGGHCARSCPDKACPVGAKCTPMFPDGGVYHRLE